MPDIHHLYFIINPFSGQKLGLRVARLLPRLMQTNYPEIMYRIIMTRETGIEWPADYTKSIPDLIIAVGGDGTASLVMDDMLKQQIEARFSIIPIGVGNDLAREFGFNNSLSPFFTWTDLKRRVHMILHSNHTQGFDIYRLGQYPMINYCSLGYDAEVLARFHQTRNKLGNLMKIPGLNKILYFGWGVLDLPYRIPPGSIEIILQSGDQIQSITPASPITAILISNIRSYGGGSKLHHDYSTHDKQFEIIIIDRPYHYILLALNRFIPGLSRRLEKLIPLYHAASADLKIHRSIPIQIDGEKTEINPESIKLEHSGQIRVITKNFTIAKE
ncbi:MAG: hypothetical protein KBA26_03210 [Candidatus Delongbacteria bacterium]|nr:hypothetical protein [Candidatus Delongbacteria bacterium]